MTWHQALVAAQLQMDEMVLTGEAQEADNCPERVAQLAALIMEDENAPTEP
jgi:hypothetical protein